MIRHFSHLPRKDLSMFQFKKERSFTFFPIGIFWAVTVIDHDLFGYAILDVGLVNNGIALILFIGEDGLYR